MLILSMLLHFLVACLLMLLVNRAGARRWRQAVAAHWTERARLLWPVRLTAAYNVFLLPVLLFLAHAAFFPDAREHWLLDGGAALLGAMLGCFPLEHKIFPQLDFRQWRHQVVAGWGIRFGIWGLFIAGVFLMPEVPGWRMAGVAAGYLLLHLAIQWGLLLRYLQWVRYIRPAAAPLRQLVATAAAEMQVTPRAVWQMAGPHAQAIAFPPTRELVFTDRLLEICTAAEVTGIACHELAHLTESRAVLAGRLLGSLTLFPLIFLRPCMNQFGFQGMLLPYAVMFVLLIFTRKLSRRMEKRADQLAAARQAQEGVYACALEKLYRENQVPAVTTSNRQTHPHLYDRMVAAGVTPDYPRPAKPGYITFAMWPVLAAIIVLFVMHLNRDDFQPNPPATDSEPASAQAETP